METYPFKKQEHLDIKIEIAKPEDWEDYKKIRIEAITTDPEAFSRTPEQVAEEINRYESEWKGHLLDNKQFIILSKCNSRVIGITKGVAGEDEGLWHIRSVYVNPYFRKSSIGGSVSEEMLTKALNEIKNRGGTQARLWVKSSRINAVSLYEKCGFKKVEDEKRALELAGNDPSVLIGWQIMELSLTK